MRRLPLRSLLLAPVVAVAFLPALAASVSADASAGNGGNCSGQVNNCGGGSGNVAQDNDTVNAGPTCFWAYDYWGNPVYYVCY